MAITTYKNGDKIPVFIQVLDMCAYHYSTVTLKMAIWNHYRELNAEPGKPPFNDSALVMMGSMVNRFSRTIEKTCSIYGLSLGDVPEEDGDFVLLLSGDIYWSLISDEFPDAIEHDNTLDCAVLLERYVGSLLEVVKCLFEMLCNEEVDLDNFFVGKRPYSDFWQTRNCGRDHRGALLLLIKLHKQLRRHLGDLHRTDLYLKVKPS